MNELLELHRLWLADPYKGRRLKIQRQSVSFDFRPYDLRRAIITHNDLTGSAFKKIDEANFVCNAGTADFSLCDIGTSTFEKCDPSILDCLVGAKWNGVPIEWISSVWTEPYGVIRTNAFWQLGSIGQYTAEHWAGILSFNVPLDLAHLPNDQGVWDWLLTWVPVLQGDTSNTSSDFVSEWDSRIDGFRWLPLVKPRQNLRSTLTNSD